MLALIALCLLTAEPQLSADSLVAQEPQKAALYVSPLGSAVAMIPVGGPLYYLPFGATVPFNEGTDFNVEVALGVAPPGFGSPAYTLNLALGPMVRLSGTRRFNGAFVEPKLMIEYTEPRPACCAVEDASNGQPLPFTQTARASFQLGLDLGYQLTLGPVYIAPLIGIGAGYCFQCSDRYDGPLVPGGFGRSPDRFVASLNLNLLRVGAAW